jgi:hypothetical protein
MTNTPVKAFRLNTELVKELQKEAAEQHRTLSNYYQRIQEERNQRARNHN